MQAQFYQRLWHCASLAVRQTSARFALGKSNVITRQHVLVQDSHYENSSLFGQVEDYVMADFEPPHADVQLLARTPDRGILRDQAYAVFQLHKVFVSLPPTRCRRGVCRDAVDIPFCLG